MNKLEIILKHVIFKKYLKSKISGKLFLKKNPNEIKKISITYKKLFDIEYDFDEKLSNRCYELYNILGSYSI